MLKPALVSILAISCKGNRQSVVTPDKIDMKSYLVHNTDKSSPDHTELIWPRLRVRIYTGLQQNIHEGRCSICRYLGILKLMVERIDPLLHSKDSSIPKRDVDDHGRNEERL